MSIFKKDKANTLTNSEAEGIDTFNENKNGQSEKPAFGTKEWAKSNVNCVSGCSNDCCYCYAKAMAIQYGRKTSETWKNEVVNTKKAGKGYRKRKVVVMFPSSTDITPNTIDASLEVLKKLLKAKNEVLIVSKPHLEVIKVLCAELKEYQEHILFRFTIGSANTDTLKLWEPGAPSFEERLSALRYAYQHGFSTSISLEPTLDLFPEKVVDKVYDMVTNDIWIGLPNMLNQRLKMNGYGEDEQIMKASAELQKGQSVEWVLKLVEKYDGDKKIEYKDSITKIINKNFKRYE